MPQSHGDKRVNQRPMAGLNPGRGHHASTYFRGFLFPPSLYITSNPLQFSIHDIKLFFSGRRFWGVLWSPAHPNWERLPCRSTSLWRDPWCNFSEHSKHTKVFVRSHLEANGMVRGNESETVVAMICYVHSGKGCSGWQRRSSPGWCKASRSASFSIMIIGFLLELWWRPWRLMTSLSVSDRNALRPTSGLIWDCVRAMLVGHSTSELIQAGRNKFPKSTSLRHLKPGSHIKLWKNALRCYSPQQHEQCVRVKVIMAGFLICHIDGVLIDFCECCFRSFPLLLLAFDMIASSRLQRAIPDPNQMSCQ